MEPTLDQRSDGALLRSFHDLHDEAAFAAVLARHHRLVYGVCRRITGNDHDAEDASQAVFLVLAVKARRLAGATCVAAWLHRVARHVALRARTSAQARRRREREMTSEPAAPDIPGSGIDDILAGLPERYRAPLLLHYVEGLDRDDVGRRLGISAEAAAMRLSRGRERLRRRLGQGALTLVGGGLAGVASGADPGATSGFAALVESGLAAATSVPALLARQTLAKFAWAKAAVAACWMAIAIIVGVGAIGGLRLLAAEPADDSPRPVVTPAEGDPDSDAAKIQRTRARMEAIISGLGKLGQEIGSAAVVLQREAHLGGVFQFDTTPRALLPSPALELRADNRFLTSDQLAAPFYFGHPWGQPDLIASSEPDADVTLDQLNVSKTFLDDRGERRLSSVTLLALSGILPADDPATTLDEAAFAYFTDRGPERPWNDAWGKPIVLAWGLFQPGGGFSEDSATWGDPQVNIAGRRCADALRSFQYNRSVYIALAAAGPAAFDLRAGHEPASIAASELTNRSVDVWSTRVLPQLWSQVTWATKANTWHGASFAAPPWRGVRQERVAFASTTLICLLSEPYQLK